MEVHPFSTELLERNILLFVQLQTGVVNSQTGQKTDSKLLDKSSSGESEVNRNQPKVHLFIVFII